MSFIVLLISLAVASAVALIAVGFHWLVGRRWREPLEMTEADVAATARPLSNVRIVEPTESEPRL